MGPARRVQPGRSLGLESRPVRELVLAVALAQAAGNGVPTPSPPPMPGEEESPPLAAPLTPRARTQAPASTPTPPPPPPPVEWSPNAPPPVSPPPPPPVEPTPLPGPVVPPPATGLMPVVYPPDRPVKTEALAPAKGAVLFAPASLFGLYFSVELEVALPVGLSLFVAAGGGLFGQLGFEGGLRYAVLGTVFEGAFLDVHGQGFFLPGEDFGMAGPGLGVGYSWRSKGVVASIGVGVNLWWTVWRTASSRGLAGGPLTPSFVFPLAGFWEPPVGRNAVQPTIRLSFGPWF